MGEPLPSRTGDSPDVEVVPAPPRPPIELIVIADDHPDADDANGEWHDDADRQYAAENWHIAANRQYEAERSPKRRRLGDVNDSSNRGSTRAPMTQPARTAADAPVAAAPQTTSSIVVCASESSDQLCSTPGCCRPRRMWRIDSASFSREQICCPTRKASPTDATVASGEHSATCDAREVARSQQQSAPLPMSTPPPTTTANETAATPAPAPTSAPPPAQAHAVHSDATSAGPPILPPLSPLTLPYTSDDWLGHHQQWMLRQRAERERVDGTPGERYCWEDPNFLYGWDGPPRHCTLYEVRREAKRRRLLSVTEDHG